MPIAALSADLCRAISSSLVLNDAASVVKELIDNALDAHASTVCIEISSNTLDVIQVRDNGTGVDVEDRQHLCKPGHTSKIRTIDELTALGGTCLGFRGQALASLTHLSGSVNVTTRIDGEIVGSALKYGSEGSLLSSTPVSHPVGTTVRIQDFLSNIPVRKELAIKSMSKTLDSVRGHLYSYALARPQIRFALKVLKTKNSKMNCFFAASSVTAPLSEVAAKVVGRDVSSLCKELTTCKAFDHDCPAKLFTLQVLLLDPLSDLSHAPGSDRYFSVDGRPLSAEKGVMREFSRLYKKYLRNICEQAVGKSSPSRPFLYVKITCPPGSYDVNIEPAKDEVLFLNPDGLIREFEQLLTSVYGELGSRHDYIEYPLAKISNQGSATLFNLFTARENATGDQGLHVIDSNNPIETPSYSSHAGSLPSARQESANLPEARIVHPGQLQPEPCLSEVESSDTFISNPWTLAKMNVVLSPEKMNSCQESGTLYGVDSRLASGFSTTMSFTNGQLPSPATSPIRDCVKFKHSVQSSQGTSHQASGKEEIINTPVANQTSPSLEKLLPNAQRPKSDQGVKNFTKLPDFRAHRVGKHPHGDGQAFSPADTRNSYGQLSGKAQRKRIGEPYRTGQTKNGRASVVEKTPHLERYCSIQRPIPIQASLTTSNRQEQGGILTFEKQEALVNAGQQKPLIRDQRQQEELFVQSAILQAASPILNQDHGLPVDYTGGMQHQEDFGTLPGKATTVKTFVPKSLKNSLHEDSGLDAYRSKAKVCAGDQSDLAAKQKKEHDPHRISESDISGGYLTHHNLGRQYLEEAGTDYPNEERQMVKGIRSRGTSLELIPAGFATYQFVMVLNSSAGVEEMKSRATRLTNIDEYSTTGTVNGALSWEVDLADIELWECRIHCLMKKRLSNPMQSATGGSVPFDLDIKNTLQCHMLEHPAL